MPKGQCLYYEISAYSMTNSFYGPGRWVPSFNDDIGGPQPSAPTIIFLSLLNNLCNLKLYFYIVCDVVRSIRSSILHVWFFCGNLPGSYWSVLQQCTILGLALNLVYQENLYPLIMVHDMFYPMSCKGWFISFYSSVGRFNVLHICCSRI